MTEALQIPDLMLGLFLLGALTAVFIVCSRMGD